MTDQACQQIEQDFIETLKKQGAALETIAQQQTKVFKLEGLGWLMLTATDSVPGSWQLDQALVEQLQQQAAQQDQPLWIVLLIVRRDGRGANGYILPDLAASPLKRPLVAENGSYQILEKRHLDSLRLILSTEKLATLLLRQRE